MCTSPILIRNKRFLQSNSNTVNSFVSVPCGHCDECLRARVNQLFVRSFYEAKSCYEHGGCGFMCTLTYDNSQLPYLEYNGKKYKVFNKKHLIDFLKRLRINLDRFFQRYYGCVAPDFKYLITSEYGSNPFASHRPHYHCIFLFQKQISLFAFRQSFLKSFVVRGKSVFGKIYQCDKLDLSKGGIKYVSKYVLKDETYYNTNKIIDDLVSFSRDCINSEFAIIQNPVLDDDFFYNRCIRSRKDYKKAVCERVLPYKHMKQFYMVSNDFGCSCIIDKYGDNLSELAIDTIKFSIPKNVVSKYEKMFGSVKSDILKKNVFLVSLLDKLNYLHDKHFLDDNKRNTLYFFARNYIQPRYGSMYLNHPSFDFYRNFDNYRYDDFSELFGFYSDNSFFELRTELLSILDLYERVSSEFRGSVAFHKNVKEREDYIKKKFNQFS